MIRRTSAETAAFQHPFRLRGTDKAQPAGPYRDRTARLSPETKSDVGEFVATGSKRWLASDPTELKLTALVIGGIVLAALLT